MNHAAPGLSILHKLKYEHIQLNSYSKMRVDLAAQVIMKHMLAHIYCIDILVQVLSKTVADAFSHEKNDNLRETERFVRNFDRFFDCMNVRNFKEAIYRRKPDLTPYRCSNDPRLSVSSCMH